MRLNEGILHAFDLFECVRSRSGLYGDGDPPLDAVCCACWQEETGLSQRKGASKSETELKRREKTHALVRAIDWFVRGRCIGQTGSRRLNVTTWHVRHDTNKGKTDQHASIKLTLRLGPSLCNPEEGEDDGLKAVG